METAAKTFDPPPKRLWWTKRVLPLYVIALLFYWLTSALGAQLGLLVSKVEVPVICPVLQTLITFYFSIVSVRFLGTLYYCYPEKFRWAA